MRRPHPRTSPRRNLALGPEVPSVAKRSSNSSSRSRQYARQMAMMLTRAQSRRISACAESARRRAPRRLARLRRLRAQRQPIRDKPAHGDDSATARQAGSHPGPRWLPPPRARPAGRRRHHRPGPRASDPVRTSERRAPAPRPKLGVRRRVERSRSRLRRRRRTARPRGHVVRRWRRTPGGPRRQTRHRRVDEAHGAPPAVVAWGGIGRDLALRAYGGSFPTRVTRRWPCCARGPRFGTQRGQLRTQLPSEHKKRPGFPGLFQWRRLNSNQGTNG